jgi:hypothetical protein
MAQGERQQKELTEVFIRLELAVPISSLFRKAKNFLQGSK